MSPGYGSVGMPGHPIPDKNPQKSAPAKYPTQCTAAGSTAQHGKQQHRTVLPPLPNTHARQYSTPAHLLHWYDHGAAFRPVVVVVFPHLRHVRRGRASLLPPLPPGADGGRRTSLVCSCSSGGVLMLLGRLQQRG